MPHSPTRDELSIEHPGEIAGWLEEMVDDQVPLCLDGTQGHETWSLQPLCVRRAPAQLDLRLPGLGLQAPSWVLRGPVHAHAALDRIRLEFDLPAERQLVDVGGVPVLRLALPESLRRHQRRQAFRVQPTHLHRPRALLPRVGTLPLRLRAVDLSAGGVALLWSPSLPVPQPGDLLPGVELELARDQRFIVQLQVQHVRPGEGGEPPMLGCAFVALSSDAERHLALYLNQLQRRQRNLDR